MRHKIIAQKIVLFSTLTKTFLPMRTKKRNILIAISYVLLIGSFSAWHVSRTNSLEKDSYTQGFEDGKQEGLQDGKIIGYNEGYQNGYNEVIQKINQGGYRRQNVSPNYNNHQPQPTRCVHCNGRGVNTHFLCNGEGCFSCDDTGLETCFFCKGKGYN